jgi:hypothetical protein
MITKYIYNYKKQQYLYRTFLFTTNIDIQIDRTAKWDLIMKNHTCTLINNCIKGVFK